MDVNTNPSLEEQRDRVFNFMDEVKAQKRKEDAFNEIRNTPEAKLRRLDLTKKDGVDRCLNTVLGTLYQKSLPVNTLLPQSTCINGSIQKLVNPMELQDEMSGFISGRSGGQGPSYYVHEAIKRNNSPVLKKLVEECTRIVNEQFADKALHPEEIDEEDYQFKLSGESEEKLNNLMDSLQLNDLSDIIKQNVETTTINEIESAKKEKEERKELEDRLTKNNDMTTESAIDHYLLSHNLNTPGVVYQPSLFEGILIGKFNTLPYTESVSDGPIDNVEIMTEGSKVVEKVRGLFMSKDKRELLEDFKTYQGAFHRMEGMYKNEVKSLNHKELISNAKAALNHSSVSPKCTLVLPDIAKLEETIEAVKTKHKAAMKNPKQNFGNPGAISTPKRKYSVDEALKQYNISVNYLDSYFGDPKRMEKRMAAYQKTEAGAKRLCSNTKELKRVDAALSGLLVTETTLVLGHIQFVKMAKRCIQALVKATSRQPMKEAAFEEAVKEYTMLSCVKALKLEDFPLQTVRQMAREYAQMK